MWPTSELPIWPSGRPTAVPEACRVVRGAVVQRRSKLGVRASATAFPGPSGAMPKPSRTTSRNGLFISSTPQLPPVAEHTGYLGRQLQKVVFRQIFTLLSELYLQQSPGDCLQLRLQVGIGDYLRQQLAGTLLQPGYRLEQGNAALLIGESGCERVGVHRELASGGHDCRFVGVAGAGAAVALLRGKGLAGDALLLAFRLPLRPVRQHRAGRTESRAYEFIRQLQLAQRTGEARPLLFVDGHIFLDGLGLLRSALLTLNPSGLKADVPDLTHSELATD